MTKGIYTAKKIHQQFVYVIACNPCISSKTIVKLLIQTTVLKFQVDRDQDSTVSVSEMIVFL